MSKKVVYVRRADPEETSYWHAFQHNGALLFEIGLYLSSVRNHSQYIVTGPEDRVMRRGRFHFEFWDPPTIARILTAIVTGAMREVEVEVEVVPPVQQPCEA